MKNVGEYPNKIWDLPIYKMLYQKLSQAIIVKNTSKKIYGVQKKGVICFYSRE